MRRKPSEPARKPRSLPVIHILLALAEGALHGYAIKQSVEERTGGALRLGPGTLYEAIQRLQADGLIEEDASRGDDAADGQKAQRRYYALTARGWEVLRGELRQLDAILEQARANPRLRKGLT
jgi:DNA-binding PadR family transcriptional regulator